MQPSRRLLCGLACGLVAMLAMPASVRAGADQAPQNLRVALQGYDPVAYFIDGKPVKGSAQFWSVYDDTVYHFATAAHRDLFAKEPDRYAPQYAGFCAGGVAIGMARVEADPHSWAIADGRLFVFFARSDLVDFDRDKADTIRKADANWQQMRSEK